MSVYELIKYTETVKVFPTWTLNFVSFISIRFPLPCLEKWSVIFHSVCWVLIMNFNFPFFKWTSISLHKIFQQKDKCWWISHFVSMSKKIKAFSRSQNDWRQTCGFKSKLSFHVDPRIRQYAKYTSK